MPNVFKPGAPAFSVRTPSPLRSRSTLPWYDLALLWLFLVVVFAGAVVAVAWMFKIG